MGQFAAQQHIVAASLLVVGGADDGSRLVVGPREDRTLPLEPMQYALEHAHEVAGLAPCFATRPARRWYICTWPAVGPAPR